jgi:hypothetical protein
VRNSFITLGVLAGLLLVAACPLNATFKDLSFSISDDEVFVFEPLNSDGNLSVDLVPLGDFPPFEVDGKEVTLSPRNGTYGSFEALVVGFDEMKCFSTVILDLDVHSRPRIVKIDPVASKVDMSEGDSLNFSVDAFDSDSESLNAAWSVDGVRKGLGFFFGYSPGFEDAGIHNVSVTVIDDAGLSVNRWWRVDVRNTNRRPVLIEPLPRLRVYADSETAALRLTRYFYDPDGEVLSFVALFENQEGSEIRSPFFTVSVDNQGKVSIHTSNWTGTFQVTFVAIDSHNASTRSNTVITSVSQVELAGAEEGDILLFGHLCGDRICSGSESCQVCEQDCGICGGGYKGCTPRWNCTAWAVCILGELQTRTCVDANHCELVTQVPDVSRVCSLPSSCNDKIQNEGEEDVDCGGPCDPCASCFDGMQNGGEYDIDCGGPCDPCSTCADGERNGFESDVDCGGPCSACDVDKRCDANTDCVSFVCSNNACVAPTCSDGTRNQGEVGIDCGGPCGAVCPTCSDGFRNGGESGVDCGGVCSPCPSCHDAIKNQGELMVDCGGPCSNCSANNFGYVRLALLGGGIIVLIVSFLLLRRGSRMVGVLVFAHRLLPVKVQKNDAIKSIIMLARDRLTAIEKDVKLVQGKEPYDTFYNIIEELFSGIAGINMHDAGFESSLAKLPYSWAFRRLVLMYRERIMDLRNSKNMIVPSAVQGYAHEALDVLGSLSREA